MTKDEKYAFVKELTDKIKQNPNFFVLDIGGFSVEKTNNLRRKCFESGLKLQTVKNKLLIKALDNFGDDYKQLYSVLKKPSALLFVGETPNEPAKMLKDFRLDGEKPAMKGAVVDNTVFLGDSSLDVLATIKSKNELLGEVIGLLQSPMQNVLSGLLGGGTKIHGLLETLGKRGA